MISGGADIVTRPLMSAFTRHTYSSFVDYRYFSPLLNDLHIIVTWRSRGRGVVTERVAFVTWATSASAHVTVVSTQYTQ